MLSLSDYVEFAKAHGRESAKFLTKYKGEDIYAGTFLDNKPHFYWFSPYDEGIRKQSGCFIKRRNIRSFEFTT